MTQEEINSLSDFAEYVNEYDGYPNDADSIIEDHDWIDLSWSDFMVAADLNRNELCWNAEDGFEVIPLTVCRKTEILAHEIKMVANDKSGDDAIYAICALVNQVPDSEFVELANDALNAAHEKLYGTPCNPDWEGILFKGNEYSIYVCGHPAYIVVANDDLV